MAYLGFLFASCISYGLPWAVVHSTRHSTASVLSGQFEAFVFGEGGVVLDVERGEGQPADEAAGGDPGIVGETPTRLAMPLTDTPSAISNTIRIRCANLRCTKDLGQGLSIERMCPCPSSVDGSARSSRLRRCRW